MVDEQHRAVSESRRAVARRSVMASAWAAPVILTAAAAPAHAASGSGFDVALDPPQMGSGSVLYDADFTRIYVAGEPVGYVVANHGNEPAPGGFPMSVTCDNRVWEVTAVKGGFGTARADLPITARVQDGHATTVTFTIPEVIPPHTDSYTGFFVSVTSDFRAAYPHDGISSVPSPTRWEVTPPPGDTDVADNAVHYAGYTDQGPADIWGPWSPASPRKRCRGRTGRPCVVPRPWR